MIKHIKKIFELEASTGILIFVATIISLLIANSVNYQIFDQFFLTQLPINIQLVKISKNLTLLDWINDGLMAIFFFLIGLELKKELLVGELSSKSKALLPAIAACGGVIFPALIFYLCNFNQPQNLPGFAIPTATDIAFAYGVLCLFGNKISKSLKVFLISLAIFDDLIAIIIISLFYSQDINSAYLLLAGLILLILLIINLLNYNKVYLYLVFGLILWLMVLKSGVHPTIAGVILAMFIPNNKNLANKLIHQISPAVNFFILPIFAFANSGVKITNFSTETITTPLVIGIVLGLFFGKQIGIMLFSFLAVRLGFARLPKDSVGKYSWLEFYAVVILAGIGFTMSFFIGSLAFTNNKILFDEVKIAVLLGSSISALTGAALIYIVFPNKNKLIKSKFS